MASRISQRTRFPKFSRALTALSALALLGVGGAFAATITFTDFSDVSAFTLNGETAALGNPVFFNGQDVLRLLDQVVSGQGSAFLTTPVVLGSGGTFSTVFQFQITDVQGISDGDGQGADGFVFVLQDQSATALGGFGNGIGYSGISPSLGVEFDTFEFPNGNHVGVNLNGSLSSVAAASVAPRLNNGAIWFAWVDYDGAQQLLQVRVSQTATRPTLALCHTLDLPSILGQSSAFIGFTSGSDAASQDPDIREWEFTDASSFTLDPNDCGLGVCANNVTDPGEECDGSDDALCPGQCNADCTCPPLLVELESFTAEVERGGVSLQWKTTVEIDNAGFRILRAQEGEESVVISPLIPARGTELTGAEYEFLDRDRLKGTVKYYLDDIDVFGVATRHGPVVAAPTHRR